ncbi:MAG TPA: hypothetical protein VEG64_04115 [Candidatus Sulfotelmatobacter sp.]|nr:hypothetical protein [Candidatus Sulfotelmatobacter sp.]
MKIPGLAGLAGRIVAYSLSGELVAVMWLLRPACPLWGLLHSSVLGYRTKLAVLAAGGFLLGIVLHTLAPPLMNTTARALDWLSNKKVIPPADVLSRFEIDSLNRAHAALEAKSGEEIKFEEIDQWQALRTVGLYYMTKFPDLQEAYLSDQVVLDVVVALVPALLLSLFVTAPGARTGVLGALIVALFAAYAQRHTVFRTLARNVAVGHLRDVVFGNSDGAG